MITFQIWSQHTNDFTIFNANKSCDSSPFRMNADERHIVCNKCTLYLIHELRHHMLFLYQLISRDYTQLHILSHPVDIVQSTSCILQLWFQSLSRCPVHFFYNWLCCAETDTFWAASTHFVYDVPYNTKELIKQCFNIVITLNWPATLNVYQFYYENRFFIPIFGPIYIKKSNMRQVAIKFFLNKSYFCVILYLVFFITMHS